MVARAKNRPNRVPVSGQRDILTVDGLDDNYVYRWVNDQDDGSRLAIFERAGYTFVPKTGKTVGDRTVDGDGNAVGSVVSRNVGGGVTAYLMAIPKDLYEADQKSKIDRIAKAEETMRRSGPDGKYGSIDISR